MSKGRTPDTTPNKVMNASAKSTSNPDGSRTFSIAYNDENGNRLSGELTVSVENGALVARSAVAV